MLGNLKVNCLYKYSNIDLACVTSVSSWTLPILEVSEREPGKKTIMEIVLVATSHLRWNLEDRPARNVSKSHFCSTEIKLSQHILKGERF